MYRNVSDAFREELRTIWQDGEVVSLDGREIKELRSRLIQIASPLERVAIIPDRYNIFAKIAATLAAIAGRNSHQLLSHYLPEKIQGENQEPVWKLAEILQNLGNRDRLSKLVETLNNNPNPGGVIVPLFDSIADSLICKNGSSGACVNLMIRQRTLHLAIFRADSDIWKSFSAIETFFWSVFQEMMAFWTETRVGNCSYFINSLQVENSPNSPSRKVFENYKEKTPYHFGLNPSSFTTKLYEFDEAIGVWVTLEEKMRQGETNLEAEIDSFADNFLRNSLQLLYLYNRYHGGADVPEIANLIEKLPSNDFKIAAIAYFAEEFNRTDFLNLSEKERDYFNYLWDRQQPAESYSFADIFQSLSILHDKKTLVYKNSWKKHGEALGVFAGISRKYDRLETMFTENVKPTADESVLDTFADLAVYSTKYLTYIAEHYPSIFKDFILQYSPVEPLEHYWYNEGFDSVAQILIKRYQASEQWQQLSSYQECFEAIRDQYKELEDIFVKEDWRVSDPRKCTLSADLAIVSVHYLVLASQQEPANFQKFATAIENL